MKDTTIESSGAEAWAGRVLRGKYRLERLLGSGGWGAVFEAEHLHVRRRVAIKLLHPDIAADRECALRFRREAKAASEIGHANIVEVFDLDRTEHGEEFIVFELLRGRSLGALLREVKSLSLERALPIFVQVAEAIDSAHRVGIVHRDLKPDNVFLCDGAASKDFVKILDFGIAKLNVGLSFDERTFTHTGIVLGTPYYIPCEQIRGERSLDHRADVYSLGVLIFETLCGQPPFDAETLPALVMKVMSERAAPLDRVLPTVPPALARLVERMLEKEPCNRPASMREVIEVLRRSTAADARVAGAPSGVAAASSSVEPVDDDELTSMIVGERLRLVHDENDELTSVMVSALRHRAPTWDSDRSSAPTIGTGRRSERQALGSLARVEALGEASGPESAVTELDAFPKSLRSVTPVLRSRGARRRVPMRARRSRFDWRPRATFGTVLGRRLRSYVALGFAFVAASAIVAWLVAHV